RFVTAVVVYHHFGSRSRQGQGASPSDPPGRAGDQRHFSVQAQLHGTNLPASAAHMTSERSDESPHGRPPDHGAVRFRAFRQLWANWTKSPSPPNEPALVITRVPSASPPTIRPAATPGHGSSRISIAAAPNPVSTSAVVSPPE